MPERDDGTIALIVGAGPGLSASLARKLAMRGHHVVLAARDPSDLTSLVEETGGEAVACDASREADVAALFERIDTIGQPLEVAIYNPSARSRGPLVELDPADVRRALDVTAFGAFLVAQQAARRMLARDLPGRGTSGGTRGTILFTGASAGVKGFPKSAPFAMGKFALRGLAQSIARELHPQGIHVGHVVVDGGIDGTPRSGRTGGGEGAHTMLDPDAIADTYMNLIDQHRSCWTHEIEVRPWVETF